ncbi:MAG: hypothetical protein JSR33_10700 [Proteobacteria bacterium]|nr:hypothetical protein [Pseudomonadota bacterium]
MKQFLFWIFLLVSTSANAVIVDSMFIIGTDYKLLHISNDQHSGYLYAENYQHQNILIYKSKSPYPPNSNFSTDTIKGTDIIAVSFDCNTEICTRYFNRRTNKISSIYSNVLDYNSKKGTVAYYLKNKNLIVINRAFENCKKSLTYSLTIYPNSIFGDKTYFLKNGDLQVDYADTQGNEHGLKIFHINYPKLFDNCTKR